MREFESGFFERILIPAMYRRLFENMQKRTIWQDLGLASPDRQVSLVLLSLLFIMERTLMDQTCTVDDVASYIKETLKTYYNNSINSELAIKAARVILQDILSNGGEYMSFEALRTEDHTLKEIPIRFVETEIREVDGRQRASYRLSYDAFKLLLTSKEIPDGMQLDIHSYIIGLHLKKQNYGKALDEGRYMLDTARAQKQKTIAEINSIRRDPSGYSKDDYVRQLNENIESLGETKKKVNAYRTTVKVQIKAYRTSELEENKLDRKQMTTLENLQRLQTILNYIDDELRGIMGSHQILKKTYLEEMNELLTLLQSDRISFRRQILSPLLKNGDLIEAVPEIFGPLFVKKPAKIFNPEMAFQTPEPDYEEDEEDYGDDDQVDVEELMRQETEREQQEAEKICHEVRPLFELIKQHPDGYSLREYAAYNTENHNDVNISIWKPLLLAIFYQVEEISGEVLTDGVFDEAPVERFMRGTLMAMKDLKIDRDAAIVITQLRDEPKISLGGVSGMYIDSGGIQCTDLHFELRRTTDDV